MKTKTDYDKDNDILYFYPNEKKVDFSIDYDDVILDVSGNKVVGVEIIDATEKFSNGEGELDKIKQALISIKDAYMKITYTPNSILVKIGFISEIPERTREGILIQVPIKRELMVAK